MPSEQTQIGARHKALDRVFHWVMAATVIILTASAFLPILGIRFDWVPIHWISGVALVLAIAFHLFRVAVVHGFQEMMPGREDIREAVGDLTGKSAELKPAKYDAYQKGYHWASALSVLAVTVTGVIMLLKIDTPFWRRDPSILSDQGWGIVYVIHGVGSLAILFLVILHIYFSILPEHRAMLKSMIAGRGPLFARGSSHEQD